MADPLSITASIIGVVTFAAQVSSAISIFIEEYRAADSELKVIAAEVDALRGVLERLQNAYETAGEAIADTHSSLGDKLKGLLNGRESSAKNVQTDRALKEMLDCLDRSMRELDGVVKKSRERMAKGGVHKFRVQAMWRSTAAGIEKIRNSLSGYKMTLMLLLQAKILETSATPKAIRTAVKAAIKDAGNYKNVIDAGEQRMREIRQYLDEIEELPAGSGETQIGSPDAIQTFPSFEAWLASFSGAPDQEQEDEFLLQNFKKNALANDKGEDPGTKPNKEIPVGDTLPAQVRLIITDLQTPGSPNPSVEQLYFHSNTEIREVLRILRDRGYSSVTGLQTQGITGPAMMGPIIALSSPVPVSITSGKSCYDISKGLSINEGETLLAFYNRFIMYRRPPRSELSIRCQLDGIYVMDTLTGEESMIRLCRTLRVPEDGRVHNIPTNFGPFPLIDISKCASANVPPAMKKKGGLMVPMLQREAMCIAFGSDPRERNLKSPTSCLLAVRLYAGGVNVISGRRSTERQGEQQDYYVAPLQGRVDGFSGVGEQHLKQFVAMPLCTGYSIESQLAGTELGGIQFQIAPRMKACVHCQQLGTGGQLSDPSLSLTKTPRELGLRLGQTLRMTEERGIIHGVSWTWEPCTEALDELDTWALWAESKCNCSTGKEGCSDYVYNKRYPGGARPAYLFDLSNEADLESPGALVVSAVRPISVTLCHRSVMKGGLTSEVLFSVSMTVSPFEGVSVFKARIRHALAKWYEKEPLGPRRLWIIQNPDLKQYEQVVKSNPSVYMAIRTIGITDGYVVETVERYRPMPRSPGPAEEWTMALACGGDLQQTAKKDPIPEYWNWEAAHLVNVQILNTVAFQSVTGLAAPASPISFEEYTKAGIPSMSYYPDVEMSGAVGGKFPVVRAIGDIDAMLGIKHAVRLDRHGKPVGCVVCERNICDSVIDPCFHSFCNACIRHRMRKGGQTTCILCSRPASKVIISSAPMEIPASGTAVIQKETAAPTPVSTDSDRTPVDVQQRLPSLKQMRSLMGLVTNTSTQESNQRFIEEVLAPTEKYTSDLKCRLAVAQILKDVDFPREPMPPYVHAAASAVMREAVQRASDDTVDLLLSLGVDVNFKQYPGGKSLLEQACTSDPPREYVATRLIDEGCDWSTIKAKDGNRMRLRPAEKKTRKKILEYALQKEKIKADKMMQEIEGR